jgi:hypothetical protein
MTTEARREEDAVSLTFWLTGSAEVEYGRFVVNVRDAALRIGWRCLV